MARKIGLFWGSDTGMTEEVVSVLLDLLTNDEVDNINVFDASVDKFAPYEYLLLGLSTWYDGELQSDWDEFFEQFQTIDFTGKKVALFGLGDQEGYAEFFVDGIGIIGEVVERQGGTLFGLWPKDDYTYEASKAERNGKLLGLAIDEDNQPEKTDARLEAWIQQLQEEGFLST